jgi:hypothetical protein
MEEENNTKKSYDEKKQEKERKREAQAKGQQQKNSMRAIVWWIIFLIVAALLSWGGYSLVQNELPQSEDFSVAFPDQGRQHIPFEEPFIYNSNPPSSGNHYERPARADFYEVSDPPVPDSVLVHSLEHGDIWISYKPSVSEEIKDMLRDFAAAKVVVTPRAENDTDLALVAWARVDAFNLNETDDVRRRIQDFITRYVNRGPEKIPASASGHNTYNPETGI